MLRIVFTSICVSWLVCLSSTGVAQNIASTLKLADSIESAKPAEALALYNRVLFFTDEVEELSYVHTKIAVLSAAQQDFKTSAWHYKQAAFYQTNDSLKQVFILQAAWQYLYSKQPTNAINVLDTATVFSESIDTTLYNECAIICGLSFELLNRTPEAVHYYKTLNLSNAVNDTLAWQNLNKQLLKFKYRSPKLAFAFSILLPGLGQAYCGYWADGLNSLLLNGALTTGMIFTSLSYSWLDGTLAFSPWLFRYYWGGANNAYQQATLSNNRRKQQLFLNRLKVLKQELN